MCRVVQISRYKSRLGHCVRLWLIMDLLGRRWEDLEPAWRILANYGQLGGG